MKLPARWRRRRPTVVMIAAVAAVIGLLPMPGEYYALLRIFFCGLSVYYLAQPAGVPDGAKLLLVGLAILHNPIAPIGLGSAGVWAIVNIATAGVFWIIDRRVTRASRW